MLATNPCQYRDGPNTFGVVFARSIFEIDFGTRESIGAVGRAHRAIYTGSTSSTTLIYIAKVGSITSIVIVLPLSNILIQLGSYGRCATQR